jgi:hypothetical protein
MDHQNLQRGVRHIAFGKKRKSNCSATLNGFLDVGSQVGAALTQALHATDNGNAFASGDEVSYQVSCWASARSRA